MKNKRRNSFLVGIFVFLGLTIFITSIYLIGIKENIFGKSINISAIFKDAKGLKEGDRVRLSGIDIGTVHSIGLMVDNRVYIGMNLNENLVQFVKKDSKATIGNEGLMGSKIINILPGGIYSDPVNPNDTLQTIELADLDDIMKEINTSSKNISIVTNELIDISRKINRGDGIFGKIFTDTTFTQNLDESSQNISRITENLIGISEKVNSGQGIMGKIFADTMITKRIDSAGYNIDRITLNLKEITEKINKGEGIFGRLFTDTSLTSNLFYSSKNLEVTTANLMEFTSRLNNDSSALSLLIDDEEFADSLEIMLLRLNQGIDAAKKASESIHKSGLIRMFSKDKEGKNARKEEE